ncbi:tRNA lysidine(34) synthetase TilS [Candidatus Pelagibacter sp.]|nr:tRNA lysidine(34) synthetase TilS [Candidatus Pelagibacter sp.]
MKKKSLSVKKKILKKKFNKISNKKILKIYKKFRFFIKDTIKKEKQIAVAISGGPDSLALAYLAKYLSVKEKIKVKFFIVDHRLRKNSQEEAKKVKSFLKKFNINCQILLWRSKKPKSNIQSIARKNRYELLLKNCQKNNIKYLLVGHHIDDLYENFFIRLLRGSGLKGLTSFDKITVEKNKNILILRPLIDLEKNELIFITKKIFKFYIEDPSNKNSEFQRIRIRSLISNLKKDGYDTKKFNLTIKNLKSSNSTIDFYVDNNIKKNSTFINRKNICFLNKNFFIQSNEVVFRSLSFILSSISSKYYPSRGKSISALITKIKKKVLYKVTLGGCCIEKINETILISKEN